MSEVQFDLMILGLIILVNLFITILYRKYRSLKHTDDKTNEFDNNSSTLSITPGSFMPRIPIMILGKLKNKSLKKTILIHNFLCLVVYGLFAFAIFYHF